MNKPILVAAFLICLLLLNAGAAGQPRIGITGLVTMLQDSEYTPLEEDLIVVEVTPEGVPIEKRFAKDADLFFYRQLKGKVLFGVGGVKGYENELILSLKNVSGRKLFNVSVIEEIPLEIAPNASKLLSDENFLVLNEKPAIIEFFVEEMEQDREKKLSYRVSESEKRISGEMLELMESPKALVALEEESCVGIVCKDLDPCTRDYCERGECQFEPMQEGAECDKGMQCIQGKCVEVAYAMETLPVGMELIGLVFLGIAIAFAAIVLLAKGKKKQEK